MQEYFDKSPAPYAALSVSQIIGHKVLAADQTIVGKVKRVYLHQGGSPLAGITVRRWFRPNMYIGKDYIQTITHDAVKLTIQPADLLMFRRVICADGKIIGRVFGITRQKQTEKITSITIRRFWIKKVEIPVDAIRKFGASIILKQNYANVKATYFK